MSDDTDERKTPMIEARKWVPDARGVKRLQIKNVTKQGYGILCGREPKGFRNGARIKQSAAKGETI
jgi:hypothetical protein